MSRRETPVSLEAVIGSAICTKPAFVASSGNVRKYLDPVRLIMMDSPICREQKEKRSSRTALESEERRTALSCVKVSQDGQLASNADRVFGSLSKLYMRNVYTKYPHIPCLRSLTEI